MSAQKSASPGGGQANAATVVASLWAAGVLLVAWLCYRAFLSVILSDPNYKADLLAYLRKNPDDLVNASATYISTPALKQLGSESRYFVCMRIDGPNGRKEKFVVFFSGQINQFVDATSEQCGAAAYQPFPELLAAFSPPSGKK
jgi:hypothetical protein